MPAWRLPARKAASTDPLHVLRSPRRPGTSGAPSTAPVTLYEHKGQLYNKEEYDKKVEEDKLFAKKKKKDKKSKDAPTTQPTQ